MRFSFFTVFFVSVCMAVLVLLVAYTLELVAFPFIPGPLEVLNIPSLLLVVAGVFMVTVISYPPELVRKSVPYLFRFFSHTPINSHSHRVEIEKIMQWQQIFINETRKQRQHLSDSLHNTFEGYVLGLLNTGYSRQNVHRMAIAKAARRYDDANKVASIYGSMARFAPAFGMLGTLIGLIHMLSNFDRVENLAVGLSFALMTTFYGLMFANLIFSPIEGKILSAAEEEYGRNMMVLEGIMLISEGNQPMYVYDVLNTIKSSYAIEEIPETNRNNNIATTGIS